MPPVIFAGWYAEGYDGVYADKDYPGECAILERVMREHAKVPFRSMLDMGCGGGGHAFPMAARGHRVVGFDLSVDMVQCARMKRKGVSGEPAFEVGDVRSWKCAEEFDLAAMLFGVFSHQEINQDALNALQTARNHLRPGGLLVFDFWYGPGVLLRRPPLLWKEVDGPNGHYLRMADSELDLRRQIATVHITLWGLKDGDRLRRTEERHTMRFFFPMEVELLVSAAGLDLVRMGSWKNIDGPPDADTWNAVVVARKP